MKAYLTSLSPFLLSFFIHMSLTFISEVGFHRPLIFLSFFSDVTFHRAIIFFLFLSFWVYLQIVSCSPIFSFSVNEQNSHVFLIFLIFPYELSWGKQFTLAPQTRLSVTRSLGQLTCLIFPLSRFDLPTDSYYLGILANQHSVFK